MKQQISNIKVDIPLPQPKKKEKLTKSLRNEFSGNSKATFGKRNKNQSEDDIMAKLGLFKQSLFSMQEPITQTKENEINMCTIHGVDKCESCGMVEDSDGSVSGWMNNKLVFKKRNANVYEVY